MRVQESKPRRNGTATMPPMPPKTNTPRATSTGKSSTTMRRPTNEQIATRAYYMYLERGGQHGCDQDDWYRAEQELTREMNRR